MNDWDFDDDYNEYNWIDDLYELEEQLKDDNPPKKLVNNLDHKYFKSLSEKEKVFYLYNKIRDLYSYLLTIQDVVYRDGD